MTVIEPCSGFWQRVATAPKRLLALDYDGTLAPFRVERMQATPLPGVREALQAIRDASGDHLVIISGRALDDLHTLLQVDGIDLIGSHGFEGRTATGKMWQRQLSKAQKQGLVRARELVEQQGYSQQLETKASAYAFHIRGVEDELAQSQKDFVNTAWSQLAQQHNLECRAFDGGIELRVADCNKGLALDELLGRGSKNVLCVYVGDDDTDEDAFRAAQSHAGIGIRVARQSRHSAALGELPDCAAVLEFLQTWNKLDICNKHEA